MRIGIGFGVGPFRVSQTLFRTRSRRRHRKVVHRRPGQHSGWWWCGVILAWMCAYPFLGTFYIGRWAWRRHQAQQAHIAAHRPPQLPQQTAVYAVPPPAQPPQYPPRPPATPTFYQPYPPQQPMVPAPPAAWPSQPPAAPPGAYGTGGTVDV